MKLKDNIGNANSSDVALQKTIGHAVGTTLSPRDSFSTVITSTAFIVRLLHKPLPVLINH